MGGGLTEDTDPNQFVESRHYLDITGIEGPAISSRGILIIRVPSATMNSYGEARVRQEVERFLPAGVAYLLESV